MDKITHQIRCQQWKEIIKACLDSGMRKNDWCKANGVNEKQFYYWQRIIRNEAVAEQKQLPTTSCSTQSVVPFVELKQEKTPSDTDYTFKPDIIIRRNNLTLEISNTASSELLKILGGLLNAE